jgi:hypothetical protein
MSGNRSIIHNTKKIKTAHLLTDELINTRWVPIQ